MTLPTASVARLSIPALLGTLEDSNLTTLIERADVVLSAYCGYPPAVVGGPTTFEVVTYTDFLDGPSPRELAALVLRVRPVTAITTIHDDRDRDLTYDAADLVDAGDYVLDGEEGRVYLRSTSVHGGWSQSLRAIRVVYTAGRDTGAHAALTGALVELVAHWWALRHASGLEARTDSTVTETFQDHTIPAHVVEMVGPYCLHEVGFGS